MAEDLPTSPLNLFAHEFARTLVVSRLERFEQTPLTGTGRGRDVERQELLEYLKSL